MHIEVDQSGKVEQLNKDAVIAFSNVKQYSILIPRRVKQEIFMEYKGKVRDLRYKLFSILVFYYLKSYLREIKLIIIDFEYMGKENLIKSILFGLIKKVYSNFDFKIIRFGKISKNSNAHAVAIDVFRKNRKPNEILSTKEVKKWLK